MVEPCDEKIRDCSLTIITLKKNIYHCLILPYLRVQFKIQKYIIFDQVSQNRDMAQFAPPPHITEHILRTLSPLTENPAQEFQEKVLYGE